MIEVFYIGLNDTYPIYKARVRDKAGVVSLSDVSNVYFTMQRISTGSVVMSALASVLETSTVDDNMGRVQYQWSVADTSSTGSFAAAFLFITATGNYSLPRNTIAKVVVEGRFATESV